MWRISTWPHENTTRSLQRVACNIKGTWPFVDSSCHQWENVNKPINFNSAIMVTITIIHKSELDPILSVIQTFSTLNPLSICHISLVFNSRSQRLQSTNSTQTMILMIIYINQTSHLLIMLMTVIHRTITNGFVE